MRCGHPLLGIGAPVAADVARYDMVLPSPIWDLSLYPMISKIYGHAEPSRVHRIENFSLQCKVIENTDAFGFVDLELTATDYFLSRFAVVEAIEAPATAGIVCAVRQQWTPKAGVDALIAILQRVHADGMLNSDIQSRLFGHECAALPPEGTTRRL